MLVKSWHPGVFCSLLCVMFIMIVEDYTIPAILTDICGIFSSLQSNQIFFWCLLLDSIGRILGPMLMYQLVSWWRLRAVLIIGLLVLTVAYLSSYFALKELALIPFLLSRMGAKAGLGIKSLIDYTIVTRSPEEQVERNFIILQLVSCMVLLLQHTSLQHLIATRLLSGITLQSLFLFFATCALGGSVIIAFCYQDSPTQKFLAITPTQFIASLRQQNVFLLLLLYGCHSYVLASIANNLPLIVAQRYHGEVALTSRLLVQMNGAEASYAFLALIWPRFFCRFPILGWSALTLLTSLCSLVYWPHNCTVLYLSATVLGLFTGSFYVICSIQLLKKVKQENFFTLCVLIEILDGLAGALANATLAYQQWILGSLPVLVVILLVMLGLIMIHDQQHTPKLSYSL